MLSQWWQGLASRERAVLLAGATVLALILGYALIWEPLAGSLARLRGEVATLREEVRWMRGAAVELRRLDGNRQPAGDLRQGRSLLTLVDQTARDAGLGEALRRVEPQQDERLRVQLEAVSFDRLILWLGRLQSEYRVTIVNVVIDRHSERGRVDARLVLQDRNT